MSISEIPTRAAICTPDGFIGVQIDTSDTQAFLIEGKEGDGHLIAVADTTIFHEKGFTGHKPKYQRLLPESSTIFYLPTIPPVLEDNFIDNVVSSAHVVLFQGGEDPGPPFKTETTATDLTKSYGGYNRLRDEVNYETLQQTLQYGHGIFILGICRGIELLCDPLSEAPPHHRPVNTSDEVTRHIVITPESAGIEEKFIQTPLDIETFSVPSNHHLQGKTLSKELSKQGWMVYRVDAIDNGIEIMIRTDEQGIVSGILFQGHPERYEQNDLIGMHIIEWIRQCINSHNKHYPGNPK